VTAPRPGEGWRTVALVCAAMLLLPTLVWLLAARRAPPPKTAGRTRNEPSATLTEPRPRPAPRSEPAPASAAPEVAAPVAGRVVDPDGRPVDHAMVACDDRDHGLNAGTDEDGRFTLPPEAAGCLAVASHVSFLSSTRVALLAGRVNVLALERGGAIEGDVVDERGAAVAEAQVAVESYRGAGAESAPTGQVKSIDDPRGAFRWEGLAAGSYVLTAGAPGRPPVRSRPVDVERNRTSGHVRIVLAIGAVLSGHVLDAETRRPIAGATINFDTLTTTGLGSGGFATSDANGAYTLPGAPPGPFSIRVARGGYAGKVMAGLVTRGAGTLAQDVELRAVDGGARDEVVGIGTILVPSARGVELGPLVAGGPAESAGMQKGDRLRRVDGEDASSFTLADCVQRLRGAEGSLVRLQIEREGRVLEFSLVRRAIAR
jgi:hypothetical protein